MFSLFQLSSITIILIIDLSAYFAFLKCQK